MSRHIEFALAVTLALGLLLGACDAAPAASQPPGASAAPGGSTVPGGSGDPAGTDEPLPADVIVGPGDVYLLEPTEGLDLLASYRATLTVTFEGTRAGAPASWTSSTVHVFVRDPRASLLTVDQPADLPALQPAWSLETGGVTYGRTGDGQCDAGLPEDADSDTGNPEAPPAGPPSREPAAQLPGIVGAELTGTETVNGIASEVATFGAAALGWAGGKADGRVAIAVDGGYVVQYALTVEGGAELFGEGAAGTMTRRYELTDVGTTGPIDVPAECPAGLLEAPTPADATDVTSLPGLLSLTTRGSIADTAAFYRDGSGAAGWTIEGEPKVSDTLGSLRFAASGLKVIVSITAVDGATRVEISAVRA